MQQPLRRSRSFKVTEFGTNRKLIYDFLLMINSNLPPILHRFQVMVQFSLAWGECLTLTLSLGVIPCQYPHKWCITKNLIFFSTFLPQKVSISNHFYVVRPGSYRIRWNYAEVRAITPFKVIQDITYFGTNRKPICDFLLVINSNLPPILHRFRDIASDRSKIAIYGFCATPEASCV